MKKTTLVSSFSTILALAVIVPQVALAAWWNPLSWNWLSFFTPRHQIQTAATTTAQATSTTSLPNTLTVQQMIELQKEASTPVNLTKKIPTKTVQAASAGVQHSSLQSPVSAPQPGSITCNNKYYPPCTDGGQRVCLDDGSNAYCRPPQSTQAQPVQNAPQTFAPQTASQLSANTTQQLGGALSSVYIQFNLGIIKTNGAALVTLAETEQTRLTALQNGRAQCVDAYNSAVAFQTQQNYRDLQNYLSSRGLATNTAGLAQVQDQGQYKLQVLAQQESTCEAAYPIMPANMYSQIQDAISQINDLRQRVQAGSVSDSEAISILQQYNSLQSEIYSFNNSIPLATLGTLPSASIPDISSNIGATPQPIYSGGTITCTSGNFGVNCSDGTSCTTVGMNVLNCSGPGGITTSCRGNFVMGGQVTCTQ